MNEEFNTHNENRREQGQVGVSVYPTMVEVSHRGTGIYTTFPLQVFHLRLELHAGKHTWALKRNL